MVLTLGQGGHREAACCTRGMRTDAAVVLGSAAISERSAMRPAMPLPKRPGVRTRHRVGRRASGRARPAVPTTATKDRTMKSAAAALALALIAAAPAPAAALEPLSQERYINDRLIAARIADRIRRNCDSLDARIIYAYSQARALKRYAEKKGYSEAEIETFLDSEADRARIYAVAEDYLTRQGAREGDGESFCRIGRAEIAAGTVTGSLLVAR